MIEPSEIDGIIYDEPLLESMLENLTNDQAVRNQIREFLSMTHEIDWGFANGEPIDNFGEYERIEVVHSIEEANKTNRTTISDEITARNYALLQENIDKFDEKNHLIEIIAREYGNLNYPYELGWMMSSDMNGAMLEIYSQKYNHFLKKWGLYRIGHYPCGYLSEDVIVVW